MARMRSAICSHPSRMWITVARGESMIRAKKSFAPVVGSPWSQVTSCILSHRLSPRIAKVFVVRSPISVVVSGVCSFFSVGTRSHRRLMSSCACDLFCMAPYPPAPMNHVKYLRAGPAEIPFRNWYTANTNHFHLTDSVRWK